MSAVRIGLTSVAAIYLAMLLELDRPEWASWTVLSVSLATRASSLQKSLWRAVSSIIGCVIAVALTAKNLERQEGQHKIGAASERDLDQSRSDHAQAAAELTRTRARLQAIGASVDTHERSRALTLRRIVLPQVFVTMAPSIMNQLIVVVKSSTLVSVIAVPDLLYQAMRLVNIWFEPIEILSFTALVYILFVFLLSLLLNRLADRLRARYG